MLRAVSDLNANEILAETEKNSFTVLRGLFDEAEIKRTVARVRPLIKPENDNPSSGTRPDQIMQNYQKWSIGMHGHGEQLGRFFRIIYNPLWAADIFGMRGHFLRLIEIRNHLTGMPIDFAKSVEEGELYSACRMQHYPQGGGFMQAHRDHIGEANLVGSQQSKFIQLLLVLSRPGIDFETGGAFVRTATHTQQFTEAGTNVGDVVVYDGRTVHGVADIDPHKPLDVSGMTGRLAAFATIYKKWKQ